MVVFINVPLAYRTLQRISSYAGVDGNRNYVQVRDFNCRELVNRIGCKEMCFLTNLEIRGVQVDGPSSIVDLSSTDNFMAVFPKENQSYGRYEDITDMILGILYFGIHGQGWVR